MERLQILLHTLYRRSLRSSLGAWVARVNFGAVLAEARVRNIHRRRRRLLCTRTHRTLDRAEGTDGEYQVLEGHRGLIARVSSPGRSRTRGLEAVLVKETRR